MRRLLLDTHAFLWWLQGDSRIGHYTHALIENTENEVYVSAASTWEITINKATGKLIAPDDLESLISSECFTALPIQVFHTQQVRLLPAIHQDPFDRILIAQTMAEGLELVTSDLIIPKYGLRVLNPAFQ